MDEIIQVDGALTMVDSGVLDDWYLIERAAHDGRAWMEMDADGSGGRFMTSGRITNADVEGHGCEMFEIARAIEKRGRYSAKRCAVMVEGDRATFWSPRNSITYASVPLAVADALAREIREKLGVPPRELVAPPR
jgi:hypothetical protein